MGWEVLNFSSVIYKYLGPSSSSVRERGIRVMAPRLSLDPWLSKQRKDGGLAVSTKVLHLKSDGCDLGGGQQTML